MATQHESSSSSSKSVTFASTASMRLALHINAYTDKEYDSCFYAPEDYSGFKKEIKRTVRMIEMKQQVDEETFCSRGLEKFTRDGSRRTSKNRKVAMRAVMTEQMNQALLEEELCIDCYDDEKIAAAYVGAVCASTALAYLNGLSDEANASGVREQKGIEVDGTGRPRSACTTLLKIMSKRDGSMQRRQNVYNQAA